MEISYRNKMKWQTVSLMVLAGIGIGVAYTVLRIMAGVMPASLMEVESSARTGGFIGLVLGWFMTFIVYDTPGEVFRRMGFIKGWACLEFISVAIIAFCMVTQRMITTYFWEQSGSLKDYFRIDLAFDVLIAVLFFLIITFIMQMRRLVGEGIMWNMITGRYHEPRSERRIYMFLDLKDSTAIAERLGDKKTHALINDVFFIANRLISEHRGEVLSYNGDELVASWPEKTGLADSRCLNCYRAIVDALRKDASVYEEKYGVNPEFWAGFHVGEVVIGECGDTKLSIVHIGDTPNTAARLEHQAKDLGRNCLVSGALLERLILPTSLKAEALGSIELRGHTHETEVFAIEPA